MHERHITDQRQVLADLARRGADNRREFSVAVGPAVSTETQPVTVIGHTGCNVYTVQPVLLGDIGTSPVPIGEPTEAFNLAEPFLDQGTLSAGVHALMFRLGDKNAFHATP